MRPSISIMMSSFQPARLSFVVSEPLLGSSRATSRARRRSTAMLAGPLSFRLRAASSPKDTSSCQCSAFSICQCARAVSSSFSGDSFLDSAKMRTSVVDLAVDLARGGDAAERFEALELVMLGEPLGLDHDTDARLDAAMRLRLGLGRRRRLLACLRRVGRTEAGARIRQQQLLVALERDAVVAALLDDLLDHPPIAVQRVAGDDLALEIDEADHLQRRIDLVAVLGRDRGERQARPAA